MDRGYVKLWRKSLDSGMLSNHKLWAFWTWCLMKASHRERYQLVGYTKVALSPGQFVFGRKKAAIELGMSERNIRTCLDTLIKCENLTSKATNKFTIITIVNWDTYQQQENENDQQDDQQVTSKRPASDHKQECKNEKNDKEYVGSKGSTCPHLKIVEEYNRILGDLLPAVKPKLWGGERKKNLAARWNEDEERQNVRWWVDLFESIMRMPWLTGNNDSGWTADLGWIVRPRNLVKILEGKYLPKDTRPMQPKTLRDALTLQNDEYARILNAEFEKQRGNGEAGTDGHDILEHPL